MMMTMYMRNFCSKNSNFEKVFDSLGNIFAMRRSV